MSLLERRLQLLLSQEQYRRVEVEAEHTGQSVASVIREGINMRLDHGSPRRQKAAERILRATANTSETGEDWEDIKNIQFEISGKDLP